MFDTWWRRIDCHGHVHGSYLGRLIHFHCLNSRERLSAMQRLFVCDLCLLEKSCPLYCRRRKGSIFICLALVIGEGEERVFRGRRGSDLLTEALEDPFVSELDLANRQRFNLDAGALVTFSLIPIVANYSALSLSSRSAQLHCESTSAVLAGTAWPSRP